MAHDTTHTPVGLAEPTRLTAVTGAFEAQYTDYQYCFVEFLIEHLSDVARAFDGDLQCAIVLAVIGQARLQFVRDDALNKRGREHSSSGKDSTNASRIADITGIPRQTVRRKLAILEQKGWVVRDGDGSYSLATSGDVSAARRDLSDVDRRALLRVSNLFVNLEKLVDQQAS